MAAVGQLANALASHPTFPRFLAYVGLFVPVWWAWMGFTFYADRFDTDDLPYRLLTLLGMFAVAVVATTVSGAVHGYTAAFVGSYVGVRAILIVLYARARRHVPEARGLATTFLFAFGAAAAIWLASLAVPAPGRYAVWCGALALELGAPLFAWRQLPQAPIHPRHIPERFGLLTLIVLGESVLAVVLAVNRVAWTAGSTAAAAGGFLAAAALWWIYFDFLDETTISARGTFGALTYTYMHFFVVVGLATMGVGVKLAILSAGGSRRYGDTAWIFAAGLAMAMLGLAAIQLVVPPVLFDADVRLRLATAAVALALIPFGLRPLVVVLVLTAALVAQVVYELLEHEEHAGASRASQI